MTGLISAVLCGFLGVFTAASFASAGERPPVISINVVGAPETVSDWRTQRCDYEDTPDAPPRAFRDVHGEVHLISANMRLREFRGSSLDDIDASCNIVWQGDMDLRPELYSGAEWMVSPFTEDGIIVHSLVHNEFHGHLREDLCPSRKYDRCWSNSITWASSNDGGRTYHRPAPPENLIASLPYRYEGELGSPVGYFQPTNIVRSGNFYYALFMATRFRAQKGGICVMRTQTLADPKSWRAWDGQDFSVRFVNPYEQRDLNPDSHVCTPLDTDMPWSMGGLAFDPNTKIFILVTKGLVGTYPKAERKIGIWASASYDLIHWSEPSLVLRDPSGATSYDEWGQQDALPSILDPTSSSLTFDAIGKRPYLYFVRRDPKNRPYARRLMRVAIRIQLVNSGRSEIGTAE